MEVTLSKLGAPLDVARAIMLGALFCGCPTDAPVDWLRDDQDWDGNKDGWRVLAGEDDTRVEHNGIGQFEVVALAPMLGDDALPVQLVVFADDGTRQVYAVDTNGAKLVEAV